MLSREVLDPQQPGRPSRLANLALTTVARIAYRPAIRQVCSRVDLQSGQEGYHLIASNHSQGTACRFPA